MAKIKNSFTRASQTKLPQLGSSGSNSPRTAIPRDESGQTVKLTRAGSVVQALSFGALHTKATGSSGSSGWGGLLSAATSGGASSIFGGGLLSTGTLGFVGKLLSLFGGGHSTPSAPTPFVIPASQSTSLNVGYGSGSSSISLGVQANTNAGQANGPIYQHNNAAEPNQGGHNAQVVQIVRQALLTSSSLNDVISEI